MGGGWRARRVVEGAVLASFPLAWAIWRGASAGEWRKEGSVLVAVGGLLVAGYRRAPTLESFGSSALMYLKGAVLVLAFLWDLRVWFWYLAFFGVIAVALPPGALEWGDAVQVLAPPTLRPLMTRGVKRPATLVMFYSPWDQRCVDAVPMFKRVASAFSSDEMRFARIDVIKWPELAEELRIKTEFGSSDLPAFVQFEGGKAHRALPASVGAACGTGASEAPRVITEASLVRFFSLDSRGGVLKSE